MIENAVNIAHLTKEYQLGTSQHNSLRETLGNLFKRSNKTNERFLALDDVSFQIKRGEVFGIIGRNGAGKSTLLKVLSKITTPTAGRIEIDGRVASLLEVGTGFHPELTGKENIFLNGTILGMSRNEIKSKLDEIIEFSGVSKFIDTPVKHYSSGMYVRLAFAVAAHLNPEILIIDEVLAVGDVEFQKKCLGKMQGVSKEGRTVLFVSHDMGAIRFLCDRVAVLEDGKIAFIGNADDAINYYLSSVKNKVTIPIGERVNREGSQHISVTSIELIDTSGNNVNHFFTGKEAIFKVNYHCTEKSENVAFRIQIFNSLGQLVSTLNNYHTNSFFSISSNGSVICRINKLPLLSGEYRIDIRVQHDGILSDEIESALSFVVEDGDYYGTGKTPSNKQGVLINHEWQK